MEISLTNIGRRFNRDWIFRGINYSFSEGNSYAILGRNGSGKSTVLQIIAGSLTPSEGYIEFSAGGQPFDAEELCESLTIAAP